MATRAELRALTTYDKIVKVFMNALRKELQSGINHIEMGSRLGVSGATISRWINKDIKGLRLYDALKLIACLNVDLKDIQEALSADEAKLFAILSEVNKSTPASPVTYLEKIEQIMDSNGEWHSGTTLYTDHPFSIEWLSKRMENYGDAFLFTATTDAMAPTIDKGETALVNPAETNIRPREIYCISLYGELLFARLSHKQNQVVVSFDSANEPEQYINLPSDNMQIKGRIIWVNKEF